MQMCHSIGLPSKYHRIPLWSLALRRQDPVAVGMSDMTLANCFLLEKVELFYNKIEQIP